MSVVVSTDAVSPDLRTEYWRSLLSGAIVPFDGRFEADHEVRGWIRSGEFGAVRVVDIKGPPREVFRNDKLIRRSDPGLVNVYVQVEGHAIVEQSGREAALSPGGICFVDLSRPGQWAGADQQRVRLLMFSPSLLPVSRDEATQMTALGIEGREGSAELVSTMASQLVRRLDDADVAGNVRLSTAVVDVFAAVLTKRLDKASVLLPDTRHRVLLLRIEAFIEHRLQDPRLSPRQVADAHHVSVRHLQKLFQERGDTVSGWIRRRRLERCRRDLIDPLMHDRSVASIGARWGFPDPTHFGRVFRALYDMTPGEYRILAALADGHARITDDVADTLRRN